jgi:hypothetical protein
MTSAVLFWVLMILWAIFGFWGNYQPTAPPFVRYGGTLLIFVLFAIIGWHVFGAPVHQ